MFIKFTHIDCIWWMNFSFSVFHSTWNLRNRFYATRYFWFYNSVCAIEIRVITFNVIRTYIHTYPYTRTNERTNVRYRLHALRWMCVRALLFRILSVLCTMLLNKIIAQLDYMRQHMKSYIKHTRRTLRTNSIGWHFSIRLAGAHYTLNRSTFVFLFIILLHCLQATN